MHFFVFIKALSIFVQKLLFTTKLYLRDLRYKFVIEQYKKVKEIRSEKHLEIERKKAKEGIPLINIRK
jgi:hypothetical protein